MTDFQIGILKLVKSALTGESVSVPGDFDWEEALTTAKKHQIIPVSITALSIHLLPRRRI